MRWSEIERSQPRLAELGRHRLLGPGVVLVGTIRRDGTRRISPVEPFVMDGDLWLIMMWRSTKAIDLTRDPRILVHSVITSRDGGEGEYKVRGTVHAQTDVAAQRRLADSVEKNLGCDRSRADSIYSGSISTRSSSSDTTMPLAISSWPAGRRNASLSGAGRLPLPSAVPSPVTIS